MKKTSLLFLVSLVPAIGNANYSELAKAQLEGGVVALSSGPVYLQDGILPAGVEYCDSKGHCDARITPGKLCIPLSGLQPDMSYTLSCDIENPNYSKPYPVVIKVPDGSINGVRSPSNQYLLNHNVSKYTTSFKYHLTRYSGVGVIEPETTLCFSNYDNTDAVHLKNCMAVYSTQ